MIVPEIRYNAFSDFALSLLRILREKEIEQHDLMKRYKQHQNKDILQYVNHVKTTIDPFLKKDLENFCGNFFGGLFTLMVYSADNNLVTVEQTLEHLNHMTGTEYLSLIFNVYDIVIPEGASDDEIIKIIEKEIDIDITYANKAETYLDYIHYPNEMKERLARTLNDYYIKYYKSVEQEVKNFVEQKIITHKKLLADNQNEFLNNMTFIGKEEMVDKNNTTYLYIQYFIEYGSSIYENDNVIYVFYGYGLEQRYDKDIKKIEYKELLKIISDDNRFEIIKLLGKRPWYSKELADHFGITTATMSYHIKKISMLGLIDYKSGKNKRLYYKLDKVRFKEMIDNMVSDIVDDEIDED